MALVNAQRQRWPAIAGLGWLVLFGGYCLLKNRHETRGRREFAELRDAERRSAGMTELDGR